jgi:hypothetical protein
VTTWQLYSDCYIAEVAFGLSCGHLATLTSSTFITCKECVVKINNVTIHVLLPCMLNGCGEYILQRSSLAVLCIKYKRDEWQGEDCLQIEVHYGFA